MRVTVLGAGLVGSLIAGTLADDGRFEVLVCDRSEDALGFFTGRPRVAIQRVDLASSAAVTAAVASAEVAVGAVPGFLGHAMLRSVIEAGKPVADIEQGHISTASCILANLSMKLGRTLAWDPKSHTVVGDDEANRLLLRPYRQPWKHPAAS